MFWLFISFLFFLMSLLSLFDRFYLYFLLISFIFSIIGVNSIPSHVKVSKIVSGAFLCYPDATSKGFSIWENDKWSECIPCSEATSEMEKEICGKRLINEIQSRIQRKNLRS